MSWLARSIADSLRIDDENSDASENNASPFYQHSQTDEHREDEEEDRAGRGDREDLSELTETLTRQFWGVASFLAPPPPPPPPPPPRPLSRHQSRRSVPELPNRFGSSDYFDDDDVGISGFHDEVADRYRLSDQSSNREVLKDWKMESDFRPYEMEDPIGDAVGITEEVLAFAMNIAHHPETWLDFPLEEEDDIDDFDMSDTQHEHTLAIQRLAPRLAALRIEFCPAHMSEGYFWKVYFVLLHSRLNKQDAELLSTPQIVAARAMWMNELQKRTKKETDWFGRDISLIKETDNTWHESFDRAPSDNATGNMGFGTYAFEPAGHSESTEFETEKHPVASTGMQIVDKSVIEEEPLMRTKDKDFVAGPSFKLPIQNYEDDDDDDDDDDWLKEDSELDTFNRTTIYDEDVSFSDLEDDADCTMPVKLKTVTIGLDAPTITPQG